MARFTRARALMGRGLYGRFPSRLPASALVGASLWRASIVLLPIALVLGGLAAGALAERIAPHADEALDPRTAQLTMGLSAALGALMLALAAAAGLYAFLAIALAVPLGLLLAHALGRWLEAPHEGRGRAALVALALLAALPLLAVAPLAVLPLLVAAPLMMATRVAPRAAPSGRPRRRHCDACDMPLHPSDAACPECGTPVSA